MRLKAWIVLIAPGAFLLASCGPSRETGVNAPETREMVYARGHRLYVTMHLEEAAKELARAAAMDSTYREPREDLGSLYYDLGIREEKGPRRVEDFRMSRGYLAKAEELGYTDAAAYDRLCEECMEIEDARGFLKYARKAVEKYPYDRQYYNLGLAQYGVDDFAGVVKSQREASEKFRESQYTGGFYRQMGRAYMKMDRDQTAERTLGAGVQAVDSRVAALKKGGGGGNAAELTRLRDDRIAMLLLLRHLHTVYKETEKLSQVERQLKESGYTQ